MDCTTFQSLEIDALYGELDAEGSAAMAEHAAGCASCAARFEGLRSTRGLVLSVAIEPVSSDFESRIMAAVDAGLGNRAAPPAAAPAKAESGGAKILKFMARPSFAVAATFVLVIGAGAILMTTSARNASAPEAASYPAMTPVAMPAASAEQNHATAVAAAPAPAVAPVAPMATAAPGALAFADESAPAAAPAVMGVAPPSMAKPSKAMARSGPAVEDKAFTAAKALFNAGKYAEALPKFEALKDSNPEADLYAARCIARTKGCAAAAPRFDTAAQTNAGTEIGSRATIEGAKCYKSSGDVVAARKRLETAKDEGILAQEASRELDALDRSGGGGGTGGHAAPKAPAPAPRAPPANTTLR